MKYLWLIILLFLIGCKPTGQAIETDPVREEVMREFQGYEKNLPPQPVIEDDPKREEILVFLTDFLSTVHFPEVEGYPVLVDRRSVEYVGFTVSEEFYTAVVKFRLKTLAGPINKQFTFQLTDTDEWYKYKITYLREDR